MSILGVGSDICSVDRIEKIFEKSSKQFVERLLTKNEIEQAGDGVNPSFIARRFAAKEAVSKALGTGIGKDLSFQDFEIVRKGNCAPLVVMKNEKFKDVKFHLSISDEKAYAIAFVVAEK